MKRTKCPRDKQHYSNQHKYVRNPERHAHERKKITTERTTNYTRIARCAAYDILN